MKQIWAILILLACFGVVGRIDYEVALDTAQPPENTYASTNDDGIH